MAHWLFLPNDALEDLLILSRLSSEKILELRGLLDSGEFRMRFKFYVSVAQLLIIPDESAARLCNFINHVQTQRKRLKQSGEATIDELKSFLKRHPKKDEKEFKEIENRLNEKQQVLTALFSQLPNQEFSAKRLGLEIGPLPHLASIRTYCDLRPIYDADAADLLEMFPIVTLHIVTHSEASDETKEILVQLSESDIDEIKEQIQRLEKKLQKLKVHQIAVSQTKNGGE